MCLMFMVLQNFRKCVLFALKVGLSFCIVHLILVLNNFVRQAVCSDIMTYLTCCSGLGCFLLVYVVVSHIEVRATETVKKDPAF